MQAVIMAGGKGTRLRELTHDEIPKPMVSVLGKPILQWQIANRKFPERIGDFESFMAQALFMMKIVPVPIDAYADEDEIRDVKDRPILRAAISVRADILLTGDKDFTESAITNPRVMTAAEFIRL